MKDAWKNRLKVTFLIYMVALVYMLLLAHRTPTEVNGYNFKLFSEIGRYIKYRHVLGRGIVIRNLAGNVAGFIPFGLLLPYVNPKFDKIYKTTLAVCGFSFLVEVIQMMTGVGCFDVDDIFLNTLGGIIGYVLWWFVKRIGKKNGQNKEKKKI